MTPVRSSSRTRRWQRDTLSRTLSARSVSVIRPSVCKRARISRSMASIQRIIALFGSFGQEVANTFCYHVTIVCDMTTLLAGSLDAAASPLEQLPIERLRARTSMKWRVYPPDVLPLWVAEMDVPLAEPITQAITDAVALGDTGYPSGTAYAE